MHKRLKKLLWKLRSAVHDGRAKTSSMPERVFNNVPYQSQFGNPHLVESFVRHEMDPSKDDLWHKTGATSIEHYVKWAISGCGLACFAMALEHITGDRVPYVRFADDALEHGVYIDRGHSLSAMHYEPFVAWANQHFPVVAEMHAPMTTNSIFLHMSEGRLVLASVNPNIRGYNSVPAMQKGGTLVLVTGYDKDRNSFYINNPTGFASNKSQHHHEVDFHSFDEHFAGRGVTIAPIE